jgi:streptomycin 3"-adenylyltransferase
VQNVQLEQVITVLRGLLGKDIVGAYLYGSAAMGGPGPHSDIDVMVVSRAATTQVQKRALIAELLRIGLHPRPVEVTIVVEQEIRPWRFPPRMDFQYGDWWRKEFQGGEIEPWESPLNPDLAPLIRMVLLAGVPLLGPPPERVFEPVPRDDFVRASVQGIDGLMKDLDDDTTNVVLTLARIWSSIVTDQIYSKDSAADWVLARIPEKHRGALQRARAIYLGEVEDWGDLRSDARACADHLTFEIGCSLKRPG